MGEGLWWIEEVRPKAQDSNASMSVCKKPG